MNQSQTEAAASASRKMNTLGGWCGMLYLPIVAVAWFLLGGFWPLHAPAASEAEITQFYQDGLFVKRLGLVLFMWSSLCLMIFASAVSAHLARLEGRTGPLAYLMLIGGFGGAMVGFYPPLWWLTAAYRPERSPELIYLLSDIGWLQLIGGVSVVTAMYIAVAVAAFIDRREQPVFPRWVAYFSLWVLVMFLPGQLLFNFYDGPFAWDGLLGFWIPGLVYFGWYTTIGYLIVKASGREKLS